MKKLSFLLMAIPLMYFSCRKEHLTSTNPTPKTYKVTFSVPDFTQTISNTTKQQIDGLRADAVTSNISAYVNVVQFTIFDSSGVLVRRLQQNAGVANFGTMVDSLAAGTYTVIVDAGQGLIRLNSTNLFLGTLYYLPGQQTDIPVNRGIWSDSFFTKFQLTVTNNPVNQTVKLNRIVGKLEIDFTGGVPQNAARVDLQITKEDIEYSLTNAQPITPYIVTTKYTVPDSVKGTNSFTFSQLILNTITPFNVSLTAYDSANNIIATHALANVTCQANKRTILSGNFSNSDPNANKGFSITIDPSWGSPTTIHY